MSSNGEPLDDRSYQNFHFAAEQILHGADPKGTGREGLRETPARFAQAWQDWTSGYRKSPEDVLRVFADGGENYDELLTQCNIPIYSHCEHHLAPFFGVAHIGYLPAGKIVGLSKLSRLVDVFARRLQVQERLTSQIASAFDTIVQPRGVGVVIECRHLCMESRGVQQRGMVTRTSAMRGILRDAAELRGEFLSMVGLKGEDI